VDFCNLKLAENHCGARLLARYLVAVEKHQAVELAGEHRGVPLDGDVRAITLAAPTTVIGVA
jgi:hypothetical protein